MKLCPSIHSLTSNEAFSFHLQPQLLKPLSLSLILVSSFPTWPATFALTLLAVNCTHCPRHFHAHFHPQPQLREPGLASMGDAQQALAQAGFHPHPHTHRCPALIRILATYAIRNWTKPSTRRTGSTRWPCSSSTQEPYPKQAPVPCWIALAPLHHYHPTNSRTMNNIITTAIHRHRCIIDRLLHSTSRVLISSILIDRRGQNPTIYAPFISLITAWSSQASPSSSPQASLSSSSLWSHHRQDHAIPV